jgi:thioesterase domain-containing protein
VAGLLDEQDTGDAMGVILALHAEGTCRPLFCVHPGAGMSWPYAGLTQHLGSLQPIYGLQTRALTQPGYQAPSVAAMAEDYLREIRQVQPRGPYRLLGWSFGGVVAHAMATRLQQAGEEVELLALMDAHPVTPQEAAQPRSDRDIMEMLIGDPGDDAAGSLPAGFFDRFDADAVVRVLRQRDAVLAGFAEAEVEALVRAAVNHSEIMRAYRPQRFAGDLVLFTASRTDTGTSPAGPGWSDYVEGEIDNYAIESTHLQMTSAEPLAEIGRVLSRKLSYLPGNARDRSITRS